MQAVIRTFEEFVATQKIHLSLWGLVLSLFLATALALVLGYVYTRYGTSLSNRKQFARNFILLSVTTTLVISVVKSSLALSLGLVGALSIVRFRAAIKEPEELAYLFLCIAIGLGLGANQTLLTIVAMSVIFGLIWLGHFFRKSEENRNLLITISSYLPLKVGLDKITAILKEYCSSVNLRRFDETNELLEASFIVEFEKIENLQRAKSAIQNLNKSVKISFLDNKGIF